ncbi:hypothetical protein [Gilvimarinus chinensis]|uniref:hypothetical protein n=1 Tax=Gilvimarinus chinensis TaxID=396005 RepID=UPI0012FC04C0|nr:hypothetical protein [Gilvimarinus chinensis]
MSSTVKDGLECRQGPRKKGPSFVTVRPAKARGSVLPERLRSGGVIPAVKKQAKPRTDAQNIADALRNPTEEDRNRFLEYIANH